MRRHLLPMLALYFTSLSIRFIPLLFSVLPYNIDGFPLARISEGIISQGQWHIYPESMPMSYNSKLPIFSLLLSICSLTFGVEPLRFVQVLVPIITSLSVIMVYVLTFRITKSRLASVYAGLFMALCGFYVFLTASIMKQTIGFTLLPIILYLYWERKDMRMRLLCAFLLVLIPLLHHLTSLIVFSIITLIMVAQNVEMISNGTWRLKVFALDVLLGPFLSIFTYFYYVSVKMPFFVEVVNVNAVSLFLSVYFIVALLSIYLSLAYKMRPWFLLSRRKSRLSRFFDQKSLFIGGALSILILNHFTDIFAGTLHTKTSFLLWGLPYLFLVFYSLIGFNIMREAKTPYKPFVVSIFMAPIGVMLFAFLWGLNPMSFALLYRSYDFMDCAYAICIGIAFSYSIVRVKRKSKRVALAGGFLALILLTTPFAYGSEYFFDVQNFTYGYEYQAFERVGQLNLSNVGTGQRFSSTMNWTFDVKGDGFLPWRILEKRSLDGYDYLLMEEKWTTSGVQMHPSEALFLDKGSFDGVIYNHDLIYSVKSPEDGIYLLRVRS